jgi:ATP-dependent DNA ligase
MVFDIVRHEDLKSDDPTEWVENWPQADRRELLDITVQPNEIVKVAEYKVTADPAEITEMYQQSVNVGNEGLVAKRLDESIHFGDRDWIKIKGKLDDLDLAVTAATWGTGKKAGLLASFEISCVSVTGNEVIPLGNVGTGFKDEDLKRLTEELKPHIIAATGTSVVFNPANTMVFVIKCEEIQKSGDFYACRFPVYKGDRKDKKPDTPERIVKMYEGQKRHT